MFHPRNAGHELGRRVRPDGFGSPDLFDATLVHHRDAVADRERLVVVMRDEEHRQFESNEQLAELVGEALPECAVERAERLVEHEQARRRGERPRRAPPAAARPRTVRAHGARRCPRARPTRGPRRARARAAASSMSCMRNPNITLPITSRCGNSAWSWNIRPRSRRWVGTPARSTPSRTMLPSVGGSKPAMARRSVVLPLPLGPSTDTTSPSAIGEVETRDRRPAVVGDVEVPDLEHQNAPASPTRNRSMASTDDGGEHDEDHAGGHRGAEVVPTRLAEQAEDDDGEGGSIGLREGRRTRSRRTPRGDREREPGADEERPSGDRTVHLRHTAPRRRAQHRGRVAEPGIDRAQHRHRGTHDEGDRDRAPARSERGSTTSAGRGAARRAR